MNNSYQIIIEINKGDFGLTIRYNKDLSINDIHQGRWYDFNIGIEKIMSKFIKSKNWFFIEAAMGHWVGDDFQETFPFELKRNLSEYRSDILIDKLSKTELIITIKLL
jgi:hypothetical protein